MKRFLKITKSQWTPDQKQMIYEDKSGDRFIGPPIEYIEGETIIIEASEGKLGNGYYGIVQVVGKIPKRA